MAQKIMALFIDDLDGSEAEGTTHFSLDGSDYEIDLNAGHGKELREALGKYIQYARNAGSPARRTARKTGGGKTSTGKTDTAAIRVWAREHGFHLKDRGRIPASVIAEYEQGTGTA